MLPYELHLGDCLASLKTMPDNSVDAIVTDPPYGLAFMGKRWDYDVPAVEVWAECLRVLKPGGHLLAFAGTRTQHRMAVRIEDAGFEIRDMIAWVYGSGFPKSLDVSKAIDKRGGSPGLTAEIGAAIKAARESRGMGVTECDRLFCGGSTNWTWFEGRPAGQRAPTTDTFAKIAKAWPELLPLAEAVAEVEREVVAQQRGTMLAVAPGQDNDRSATTLDVTAPATDAARQWAGWGTALKPALEPITVARKPLVGTVAANVLQHGTGAINIDECRVPTRGEQPKGSGARESWRAMEGRTDLQPHDENVTPEAGRWPANVIHDGSEEVLAGFPQSEVSGSAKNGTRSDATPSGIFGKLAQGKLHNDTGSAARFFYCAKASRSDRNSGLVDPGPQFKHGTTLRQVENTDTKGNTHPTVKPTDLMAYLVRLVTPPGGVVLDPFMGSGSTGKAAMREGFRFIGCELSPEYLEIARARIEHEAAKMAAKSIEPAKQVDLFAS